MASAEDTTRINDYLSKNPMIDVDYPDAIFNSSLLMWCIYNGKLNSAKVLLEHNANPNFVCKIDGDTPLICAASYRDRSYNIDDSFLLLLLSKGADANMISVDSLGRQGTPLFSAVATSVVYVKELIELGNADPNLSLDGLTIINVAVVQKQIETVYYLAVEKHISLDAPLNYAGKYKSKKLIDILRDIKFPPNTREDSLRNTIVELHDNNCL